MFLYISWESVRVKTRGSVLYLSIREKKTSLLYYGNKYTETNGFVQFNFQNSFQNWTFCVIMLESEE